MAWRKPDSRDLAAKLNQKEMDTFKAYPDFRSVADPAADLLAQVADAVRGFCRANKQVVLCPTPGTIPEGLITFAMDFAVYDLLKRINIVPNEARKAAWEKAVEIFKDVTEGKFIPESWSPDGSESDADSNRAQPQFGPPRSRILNYMGV